jgi:hypothetical protein
MEDINKLTIVKKGYSLQWDMLKEGHYYSDYLVAAETRNQAKSLLLSMFKYEDPKFSFSEKEVTYLNIPIKRNRNYDTVLFEDKEYSRVALSKILIIREHDSKLAEILADEKVSHCYIKKGGSYYRPGSCGYTELISRAGIYPKEKAVREGKGDLLFHIVPIDIEKHNAMILEEIKELEDKLIKA